MQLYQKHVHIDQTDFHGIYSESCFHFFVFQVLLPPYDDSVSVPPKQAPPPYTSVTA